MTQDLIRRVEVVATAAVTYIVAISTALVALAPMLPEQWHTYVAQAVAALSAAVVIIRRVSPVDDPAKHGILPQVNER